MSKEAIEFETHDEASNFIVSCLFWHQGSNNIDFEVVEA